MATILCLYFNSNHLLLRRSHFPRLVGRRRRSSSRALVVFSTHSNPKILKSNRRSPYGQQLSTCDADEDDDCETEDSIENQVSDDESMEGEEFDADIRPDQLPLSFHLGNESNIKHGTRKLPRKGWEQRVPITGRGQKGTYTPLDVKNGKRNFEKRNSRGVHHTKDDRVQDMNSADMDGRVKLKREGFSESKVRQLLEELDFDEKWFPLIDYLSTFGLKESHFIQMYERHMPCLQINVVSARERLEFLQSVGVKHRDIRKMLLRQPQILEYTVENNLKSHVTFLSSIGVPDSRIGQVITAAPSLFSYSVEHSLKPTVRYLVEEVGIKGSDVSKVVQLSPQILVSRLDSSWTSRFCFLSKELGASRDSIVKMVAKHPQLLHYSIEDGILPRLNFLRSIGMRNSDILKVLTSLTQVLSLSLEGNLKPKYLYLVNELRNEVQSLTKYPTYLSLSLEQRIRPRHRFLVSLKKAPKGPFPLSSFVPTDESFCQQWAGTSLEKYLAFRQTLLVTDFANKYQRKR